MESIGLALCQYVTGAGFPPGLVNCSSITEESTGTSQEAPRSIMGRRATDVNHLAFSVAKVLQKETGTLGQVPTVGCQPGGLRMHVWFKD